MKQDSGRQPNADQTSLALQIDRVSDLFEKAIKAGDLPDIVEFLSANSLPATESAFTELLELEIEYWQREKQLVKPEEYVKRYPSFRAAIEEVFSRTQTFHAHTDSTATGAPGFARREFSVGESIDDFDLLRRLGKGAFATVFLARQRSMQRRVALKISQFGTNESRTLAKLDHPNIVRVYDQRVLKGDRLYLLYMEYVAAGTLADVIEEFRQRPSEQVDARLLHDVIDSELREREEPLPTTLAEEDYNASWGETVCALGARLAEALDYAHRRETLHRDVKPSNILLTPEGTPKLVDFNIAYSALVEGAEPDDTFGGSLAYMSPEQLHASSNSAEIAPKDLDGRSDVFSLGVVLWEMLTGKRPFNDQKERSHWTVLAAEMADSRAGGLTGEQIHQLEQVDAPDGLADVVSKCLKPDREERYNTAGEVSRELDLCLHPKARQLVDPSPGGLTGLVRRFPMCLVLCVALIPNFILSVCNVAYDWQAIAEPLGIKFFKFVQMLIALKCVLYGTGIAVGVSWAWPVFTAAWRTKQKTLDELKLVRRRALFFGDVVFVVSIGAWMASGFVIPLLLSFAGSQLGVQHWFHISMAHVLCGAIAGVLTTFPLAYLVSRVFYPQFLSTDAISLSDRDAISRFEQRLGFYVPLMFAVCLISLVSLRFADESYFDPFIALAILAALSMVAQFCLSRATLNNFRALTEALGERRRR